MIETIESDTDEYSQDELSEALQTLLAKQRNAKASAIPSQYSDPYYQAQPFPIHTPRFDGTHWCLFYASPTEGPIGGLCWKPVDPESNLPILGGGQVRLLFGPNFIPVTHWEEPGFTPKGKPRALRALIDRGEVQVIPPELCTRERIEAMYRTLLSPEQRRDRAHATSSAEDLELLLEAPGLLVGQARVEAEDKLRSAGPRDVKRIGPRLPESRK